MNRVEAYQILRQQITIFAETSSGVAVDEDVLGESGVWYRVELRLVASDDGTHIHALIHDHNSHFFKMMEERVPCVVEGERLLIDYDAG